MGVASRKTSAGPGMQVRVVFLDIEHMAIIKFTLAPTTSSSILSASLKARKMPTITMPVGTTPFSSRSLTLSQTTFKSC